VKHLSGAPVYGRLLALPTNIRLGWKRYVGDKHSSLLRKFVNYGQKFFYNIGPCIIKHYVFVIAPIAAYCSMILTELCR